MTTHSESEASAHPLLSDRGWRTVALNGLAFLNAGYFRANVRALATETKGYVPRGLSVYERLARELGDQRGTVPFPILSAAERTGPLSLVAIPFPAAAAAE